jgi:hypothetical protein
MFKFKVCHEFNQTWTLDIYCYEKRPHVLGSCVGCSYCLKAMLLVHIVYEIMNVF